MKRAETVLDDDGREVEVREVRTAGLPAKRRQEILEALRGWSERQGRRGKR
jgi:hypothetical protein